MRKILLGVDGGNTKTDFYLISDRGDFLASVHAGPSNHEFLGYDETKNLLKAGINSLCEKASITISDIDAAAFGLAGLDITPQYDEIRKRISDIGIKNFAIANDSILGIKTTKDGIGVCSVNGTGAVTGGINSDGSIYQVGGIGDLTSDFAGGGYLSREVIRAAYGEICQSGQKTILTKEVKNLLNIEGPMDILSKIHMDNLNMREYEKSLCKILFDSAKKEDELAKNIIFNAASLLANSAVGCIEVLCLNNLSIIPVVLSGSIWVKTNYVQQHDLFKSIVEKKTGAKIKTEVLKYPPAVGAIFYAYEKLYNTLPNNDIKEKIINIVTSKM